MAQSLILWPAKTHEDLSMDAQDMLGLSACEAVAAMSTGRFSALAYTEALLARCAERSDLNAFITLDPEAVRAAAQAADARRAAGEPMGPLHGLPIPVKDSINTVDLPTTAGTAALREFRPVADATVVARLREAGAIILGKTNLPTPVGLLAPCATSTRPAPIPPG